MVVLFELQHRLSTVSICRPQSPLDISTAGAASKGRGGDGGLEFDYGKLRNVTVFNTGYGPQVRPCDCRRHDLCCTSP